MAIDLEDEGWLLSSRQILAVRQREYHYNAWSSTLLDPWLQPFWRLVVSYVPTSVAPSTLSACGLTCNIIATCVTLHHAPGLIEPVPRWVSILNAASIFAYQTFDGIDGKQCHRNQESEVEEYADHAVDSISVALNAILLAAAMGLGDSPFLLAVNFALVLSAFYAAHWAAYRTHSLVFGLIDVSEAQWGMIAIHVASAIGGAHFWNMFLSQGLRFTNREAVCLLSAATLLFGTLSNTSIASGWRKTPFEANGIQLPRRPFSLWPLMVYILIMASFSLCFWSGLFARLTAPTMLIIGLVCGKASTWLILQKLSKRDGACHHVSVLLPLGSFLLQAYCGNRPEIFCVAIWTLVFMAALDTTVFHVRVFSDLKRARNIDVFSVSQGVGKCIPKSTGFYVAGNNLSHTQKAWQQFARDRDRFEGTYPSSHGSKRG